MFVYSIRDLLAKEFGPPFIARNDDVAYRHYSNFLTSNPGIPQGDFRLHKLGEWDEEKGIISHCDEVVSIGGAS